MATVNIYLTFNGNCEQAFTFYQSVFGGEFESFSRFKEMPETEDGASFDEELGEKIMHVSLLISKETVLMGSDVGGEWLAKFKPGNNFSISVDTESKEETTKIFNALADGGHITMPLANTFWDSYFGMLSDRFGINWMVSCSLSSSKQKG